MVEDVALTPAMVPVSRRSPVPRVVGDVQRERKSDVPPTSDAESPREDVATHLVDVPMD